MSPPAIVGSGYAVPPQVRTNDDPIFDAIKAKPGSARLFTGYQDRRVLGPGESVTWLMVQAAQPALEDAGVAPGDVDLLLGFASVAEYITPNSLAQVHAELGLRADVPVIPLNDDYTNFISGLVIADALIRAGGAGRALIVCGDNWTQYVNYDTPQAVSAGDGAGAVVVGPATAAGQWTLADRAQLTVSANYGQMYMAADRAGDAFTAPWFHITQEGFREFVSFGENEAPTVIQTLLDRNGLEPAAVTVIAHQTSQTLFDHWHDVLGVTFLTTLADYANVVLAAMPLTFAVRHAEIATEHLIFFGLGAQMQAGAALMTRQSSAATSSALADAPQSR